MQQHSTDSTPAGNPFDDHLHEVLTTAPQAPGPGYQVTEAIRSAAEHLASAGKEVAHAIRHGASSTELATAFGVEADFLMELHRITINRMVSFIIAEIQFRDDRVKEARQEQAELRELIAKIEAGDVEAFRQAAKGGF